jgi:AcrR family transcriptional regulator
MAPKAAHRKGRPDLQGSLQLDVHLLATAAEIFIAHGFEGASMDQIAAAAGAGKQSLYRRYANKEALFKAVFTNHLMRENLERWDDEMAVFATQDFVAGGDPLEELHKVARTSFNFAFEGQTLDLFRLFVAEQRRFPDLREIMQQIIQAFEDEIVQRIRWVEQQGLFRADAGQGAARTLIAVVCEGPMLKALLGLSDLDTPDKREAYFDSVWTTFVASMAPR